MSKALPNNQSPFDRAKSDFLMGVISTFTVEGFPSDDSLRKVSITVNISFFVPLSPFIELLPMPQKTIDLSADSEWVTVPRFMPSAFLRFHIKNTSSYQLTGGKCSDVIVLCN